MGDLGEYWKDIKDNSKKTRETKYLKFQKETVPKLQQRPGILLISQSLDKFIISTTNFGIIDVFPKANRLLIRNKNEWHSRATHWLLTNIE